MQLIEISQALNILAKNHIADYDFEKIKKEFYAAPIVEINIFNEEKIENTLPINL